MAININITTPHFCRGPRSGAFSIIFQGVAGVLRIINESGALLHEYDLSSDITNTLLSFDYVGPLSLTSMVDGLTYFTLEKVSSSQCLIKRWEINTNTLTLDLKQTITKTTGANYYYDAIAGAIEYYRRGFGKSTTSGVNHIEINDTSRITFGMKLFLGPSTDTDNLNATEWIEVDYVSGLNVYFTSNILYEYKLEDSITTYNNYYLISNIGYGGDTVKGSFFTLDAYDGAYKVLDASGDYKNISVAKWHPSVDGVACVIENNLLFIRPYIYHLKWKSQNLNNVEEGCVVLIEIYDVAFDGNSIYKLMKKITWRDDEGNRSVEDWGDYYNFHIDTLLPYTNSINLYTDKSYFVGQNDTSVINVKVIDQFGVGLTGLNVTVSKDSGDQAGSLIPVDGVVTTDANGETSIQYTSGGTYNGITVLKAKVGGGYAGNGSGLVWNSISLYSRIDYQGQDNAAEYNVRVYQIVTEIVVEANVVKQILDSFSVSISVFGKTYFTTPGGDWINPSDYCSLVSTYLPMLPVGKGDGPQNNFYGGEPGSPSSIPNNIKQILDFESETQVEQFKEFVSFIDRLRQVADLYNDLQISQLKLAHHTHWVDGVAYDELFTNIELNQFVFVSEAVPKFWSEKNPRETNIWIRLRPFAFSLDFPTLVFSVKEVSYAGDVGFVDVTSQCVVTAFDAGGGVEGLDILYNPLQDFHFDATVYVHIEVYDIAAVPNFIYVDYWFTVIPDLRFPYLVNLKPDRDQVCVPVDTNIYFEVKDAGAGVDINSLGIYVNSRTVVPTSIVKVADNHYKVTYDPSENFYYNKEININVIVSDFIGNVLNDGYRFYTIESDEPWFIGLNPKMCKRGMPRFQDVSLLALSGYNGIDEDTIRVQLHGMDITDGSNFLPVVYRTENTTSSGESTLEISDLSLQEGNYITPTDSIFVDLVDYSYNIVTANSYFKKNDTVVSGTFTQIASGYRLTYDPQDNFESFNGETELTVHVENDNGDSEETCFYLVFGYKVEYDNNKPAGIDLGYGNKILIRVSAENKASCPITGSNAYWFETSENIPENLCISIVGVPECPPLSEKCMAVTIYPQSTAYEYEKEFTVVLTAKDYAGNEMIPYIMRFKIEDKP